MRFTAFKTEYESESASFNFEPWRITLNKFRLSLRAGSQVPIRGKIRIRESEPTRRLVSSVPFPLGTLRSDDAMAAKSSLKK